MTEDIAAIAIVDSLIKKLINKSGPNKMRNIIIVQYEICLPQPNDCPVRTDLYPTQ